MILQQSNKPCKLEKDTEPKLPDVTTESCIHRVDQRLMGEGTIITTEFSPFFQGNVGLGGLCLNGVFSQFIPKATPYKENFTFSQYLTLFNESNTGKCSKHFIITFEYRKVDGSIEMLITILYKQQYYCFGNYVNKRELSVNFKYV